MTYGIPCIVFVSEDGTVLQMNLDQKIYDFVKSNYQGIIQDEGKMIDVLNKK